MTEKKYSSLISLTSRLYNHINRRRRLQILGLLFFMVITTFIEIISIGSVLPFLAFLTNPELVSSHRVTQFFVRFLGLHDLHDLLLPMTIFFCTAAFLSGFTRFTLNWAQIRLSHTIGSDFSLDAYRKTLCQPYLVHVSRNSSEVISGITVKTKAVVGGVVLPIMTIISSVIFLLAIVGILFIAQPYIALITIIGFGLIYILVIVLTKRQLLLNGQKVSEGQTRTIKALQEGIGGIRDVLLAGTQNMHCNIYAKEDLSYRKALANIQIISVSPRYAVEVLGIILISSLAYYLATKGGSESISGAIPILGLFAMAAQRVLPMLQQSYASWSSIRGGQATLSDVVDLLDQKNYFFVDDVKKIQFTKEIELQNVSFEYSLRGPKILSGLNLSIAKGSCIGVIGSTGSGKSTLIDVILGLLSPIDGNLVVDGISIGPENLQSWQKCIFHVPQAIYLLDATIEENIALGVPIKNIDRSRVRKVAAQAQIDEFIESLDGRYESRVGERGIMLSGGQRQRIAIARALYRGADILVLDEATSALDYETEQRVMAEINTMQKSLTTIIVAHRITTLKYCSMILQMEAGKVNIISYPQALKN